MDNVTGETGWRVQMSEDGQNFNWQHNVIGSATSYTVTGLGDGKNYFFPVRAYSDCVSNPTGPNTACTPKKSGTTMLPAPTDLDVSRNVSGEVDLFWTNNATNATTVVIQRSINLVDWTNIEISSSYTDYTDTVTSGHYYYRVFVKNSLIESVPSITRDVTL